MRINKFIASGTSLSRRAADTAVAEGRVAINDRTAAAGDVVSDTDVVTLDGRRITPAVNTITIMLNKPTGYICSRAGQGGHTVYELLPPDYQQLQPVGRLDKNSSGLLLLTNDGQLAHELTHPSHHKQKRYEIELDKALQPLHRQLINDHGIQLDDGRSQLTMERLREGDEIAWVVTMSEGRNRQIRRTFAALGYQVVKLHRTDFGAHCLGDLKSGSFTVI